MIISPGGPALPALDDVLEARQAMGAVNSYLNSGVLPAKDFSCGRNQ